MNEEVSRILEMLEKGVISVDEAERLIRAAGVASARSYQESTQGAVPPVIEHGTVGQNAEQEAERHTDRAVEDFWDPFSPFSNPMPDLGDLSRALRRVKERIRRHNTRRFWRNYFRLNRWYEHRRNQRRAAMSAYERVRFVILGAPASADFILQSQTDIHELLDRDRIAWDLFRLGLEEEFGLDVSMDQAQSFRTVQDVVDWVEQRQPEMQPETPESSESNAESGVETPAQPEEQPDTHAGPSKPARRRATPEIDENDPRSGGSELPPVE